ncbi:Stress-induced acidophilic repeat motif-containing protein [Chitinophaga rupis]|uniref:Stress-induced acidophilic repeat motif-containing protein n=1 Tax=Chitinophaga rupis TaxID=573321 RepID=A0A1H8DJ36_9BACT|nr:KGG domain-containing protein [Chitinophaga rupis]SEN07195.1 Stress-induced acidophilic repeat motif-containing protein [Chitinophaga rupis]
MTMQSSHSQEENWQNVNREHPQMEDSTPVENDNNNRDERKTGKALRGFAAMDMEKQRAIASMGGRAAHQQGVAHEFSSEEARAAGRKGGEAVSQNREHMAAIGKKGGEAAHGRRRQRQQETQQR